VCACGWLVEFLYKSDEFLYEASVCRAYACMDNKVIHKVRKRRYRNPLFGHKGDEIFLKTGRK